jgi:2-octaprenyl-6-methoxyphenol hydroxylase
VAQYDVAVVGSGPVGSALALALNQRGFSVIVIEARAGPLPASHFRPLALGFGSRLILERLDAWSDLQPLTAIDRIHVSQRGRFGRAVLAAAAAGLPALGYVTDYAALVTLLDAAVERSAITVIRGARVTALAHGPESARVEFTSAAGAQDCIASLVAVADGSAVAAEVTIRTTEYGQSALTALVETEVPHGHTAFERFTPEGPIALLPFEKRYALVWTVRREEAGALASLDAAGFLTRLQQRFGERVGCFQSVAERGAHDLTLRVAKDSTLGRAVLIGNAAQSLHPVAGQGFNLGLRDAWELAEEIANRGAADARLPHAFRAKRRIDRAGGIGFTDALVKMFSNDVAPLALARGAGLAITDNVPAIKDFIVRRMVFGSRG